MPSRGEAGTAAEEMIGTRLPQRIAKEKRLARGQRASEVEEATNSKAASPMSKTGSSASSPPTMLC